MSKDVIQAFKDWMVAGGKSPNTASNYMSGVNTVSNHCGRDVFAITDVVELEKLHQAYGPKGEHASIGASNSANVHNGLRQWLFYQRYLAEAPSIDPVVGYQQWDAFLARWPVSSLQELTLEQYYGKPGDDSFFSWMLNHTDRLGDFREGLLSAGVRPRSPNASSEPGSDMQTDGQYLWYRILGDSAQSAFNALMAELLVAVDAVQQGDLSLMDGLKNAPGSLVSKVAFLYQNRAQPLMLPFYSLQHLKRIMPPGASGTKRELQQQLMARRGDKDLLVFAAELMCQARTVGVRSGLAVASNGSAGALPLNQILFGPPGTGKTFATIDAALQILDPDFLADNTHDRAALKARFDELQAQQRIRFVTFHQSFSYEDFVEGLRAEHDEDSGQLAYAVVDGVFKSLCEAAEARVSRQDAAPIELAGRRIWKMSLGNTLGEDASIYDECLAAGYVLLGYGASVDFAGCRNRDDVRQRFVGAGVKVSDANDYGVTSVTAFVTRMRPGDLVVVTDGNFKFRAIGEISGDYYYREHPQFASDYAQCRPVRWLRSWEPSLPHSELMNKQFSMMTLYELQPGRVVNMERLASLLRAPAESGENASASSARVLIIDEINRGNISRIFGELITLIEPSKRAGAEEALEVLLPYSKKPFSVPDNVYLIGTMNTADRSLAGLDIALRRRFTFKEMPPRPKLLDGVSVDGVNIGKMLQVMNQRIEVLLGRDYCLGHAYFMELQDAGDDEALVRLEMIFRQKVLPLLQEYFFEDWERIGWVLNDQNARANGSQPFIRRPDSNLLALFGSEVGGQLTERRWELNEQAFASIDSYRNIARSAG